MNCTASAALRTRFLKGNFNSEALATGMAGRIERGEHARSPRSDSALVSLIAPASTAGLHRRRWRYEAEPAEISHDIAVLLVVMNNVPN